MPGCPCLNIIECYRHSTPLHQCWWGGSTWLAAGLRLQYLPQSGLDCRQDESDRPAGPGQGQKEEAGGGGGGDDEGARGQSNEVRAGQSDSAEPGPARGDRQVSQQQQQQQSD